jgi:hypothetical protein
VFHGGARCSARYAVRGLHIGSLLEVGSKRPASGFLVGWMPDDLMVLGSGFELMTGPGLD